MAVRPILSTWPNAIDPFQARPDDHSGLDFAHGPGRVRTNSTVASEAAGTVSLADDDTNYVEASLTDGTVSANTAGFTAGKLPLYEVVTSSGEIGTVTDRRTPWAAPIGGHGNTEHDTDLVGEAGVIAAMAAKAAPVDADLIVVEDSEDSNTPKKVTKAQLLDGLGGGGVSTEIDGDDLTVTFPSGWGINGGVPYYDDAGATAGEEAAMFINSDGVLAWVLLTDLGG